RFHDGFSPATPILVHMPGARVTGLASPENATTIAHSLDTDSPTVIIEAETGARVPHFAELDMSQDNAYWRAFMIRPVVRLKSSTRYIVAIRNVVDSVGTVLT